MISDSYKKLAYEAAVFGTAARLLSEKYIPGDGGQKEELICEHLPFRDRVVPAEQIANAIARLQAEEQRLLGEMNKYQLSKRKDEASPIPQVEPKPQKPAANAGAKPGGKARGG